MTDNFCLTLFVCFVALSFELEAVGLASLKKLSFYSRFPRPHFRRGKSWSFREHRFHPHFRSQVGIVFTPFIPPDHTLCFIFLTGTRTFSFTARIVFRTEEPGRARSPWRVRDRNFVLFAFAHKTYMLNARS